MSGDLDVSSAPELHQSIIKALAGGTRWIICDISKVGFIDSFGIGVLVGALKRVRQRGGDLQLVRPVSRVWCVLEMCELDRIMKSSDRIDDLMYDPNEIGSSSDEW